MRTRSVSSSWFAGLLVTWLSAGCSSLDAKVGALQADCGIGSQADGQITHGSSYYPVGAAQTPAAATCAGSTTSSCDNCESERCCATRSACYGDPVCACADLALDQCLAAAETNPGAVASERATACWNTFSAAGSVEQARVTCQRSWCAMECDVP